MELERQGAPISVTLIKPSSIDTPYPEHARNYLDENLKIPPPVYDPHLVAQAILFAAENRKRELTVGFGGWVIGALTMSPLSLACSSSDPSGSSGGKSSGGGPDSGGTTGTGGDTASGGAASGGAASGGTAPTELPSAITLEAVASFLEAGHYKSWFGDAAPRPAEDQIIGSPHAGSPVTHRLQTYVNAQAFVSLEKNRDVDTLKRDHELGSMAVKEVYDDAGTRLALLAMIKVAPPDPAQPDSRRQFAYYCEGEASLCTAAGTTQVPVFFPNVQGAEACASCHGGNIYFPLGDE